ncbi:hypothetical protein [Streptomyces tailanensis]|uniref:hypothetical protein n=1 Tax=Streptomyces tailanensis TaxID=2569858 RepID=UPI00122E3E76|nr:hypothetical protein [Streptomyces tailanensis]
MIEQISEASTRGWGSLLLASGCRYELTAPAGLAGPNGANGLPAITGNDTITGTRASIVRDATTPFRVAEVGPQGSLSLNGITVSGGSVTGDDGVGSGGGILTAGRLLMVTSRVTDNTASRLGGGIAALSGATARLVSSTVSDNTGGDGGGISVAESATLTANAGAIRDNTRSSPVGDCSTPAPRSSMAPRSWRTRPSPSMAAESSQGSVRSP